MPSSRRRNAIEYANTPYIPTAANTTAEFVDATYHFETLNGVGHFITDQVPDAVNRLLLNHLEAHPATAGYSQVPPDQL